MNDQKEYHIESAGIIDRIISVYFWITLFLVPGIIFPFLVLVWMITVSFDRRLVILHRCTSLLSDLTLGINPYWKVTIEGRERADKKKRYVMVSNHQSGADIMALFKTHLTYKWVAKRSLFNFPFIGWIMRLNRYIPIERSRGRSKVRMMDKAVESIMQGNSIMMFPEGTRTMDGSLQPFKSGAFRVALETQADILPIAIIGTFHAIRKGSLIINKNKELRAVILKPIPNESFKEMHTAEVAQMVHDLILSELRKK